MERLLKISTQEGFCGDTEFEIIKPFLKNVKNVLEIGFNSGVSSAFFLENNVEKVVSFDICRWGHELESKKIIDEEWPNQHELVIGDSIETVPNYKTDTKFDLIFIDGYHWEEHPRLDIKNCKPFAHGNTIVIVDNISFKLNSQILREKCWPEHKYYCVTDAWNESVDKGIIFPIRVSCEYPKNSKIPVCMGIAKYY